MISLIDHKRHRCLRAASLRVSMTLAMILAILGSGAQTLSDSTEVRFRLSHSELDTAFSDNGRRLRQLSARLDSLADSSAYRLKSIRVIGAASPEGPDRFNRNLSQRRAESIYAYFAARGSAPDSLTFDYLGRDWSGLYRLVSADDRVPSRARVLQTVEEAISSASSDPSAGDRALARLKRLDGGAPYRYIYNRLFPQLRASRLIVEYTPITRQLLPPTVEMPQPAPVDSLPETNEFIEQEIVEMVNPTADSPAKPFYMALKTNMLYDALALPNIGAEFYLGRGWSIGANWMYGWWSRDNRHRYWRAYGGDLTVRRWLGKAAAEKPLTGHHLGLYAGVVTYDFEFGHTGYMGGNPGKNIFNRCNYYGGIEYGYSLPVGRRMNIDFSIGIGYLGGKYQKYTPCPSGGYLWQSTHRIGWFGPTKAEISLVWLIGRDNVNRNK